MFSGHNPTMERGVTDRIIGDCLIENVGVVWDAAGHGARAEKSLEVLPAQPPSNQSAR